MSGMFKFDFFVRDWLTGTRGLSDRARGVYIDLLARMYDLGRSLDHDEKELCRFLGYRDYRQLRPVLKELLDQRKIQIQDGQITNDRAMCEIAAFQKRSETGKKGGRPPKKPPESDQKATRTAPASDQRATSGPSQGGGFEENQATSENTSPSPSPSPSPKKEEDSKYVFERQVIRLTRQDFNQWTESFSNIDLKAALEALEPYYVSERENGTLGNWYSRCAATLAKKNQEAKERGKTNGADRSTMHSPAFGTPEYDERAKAWGA